MNFACAASLALSAASAAAADASPAAPVGAWRSTNDCFLAAFLLNDGGRAQALYLSGGLDGDGAWTWAGGTLTLTSAKFPFDRFAGHLAGERLEVDYVWHELEKDELHRQACIFERFTPASP